MNLYQILYDIIVKSPIVQLILIVVLFRFIIYLFIYLFKVIFFTKKNIIVNNINNQTIKDEESNIENSINISSTKKTTYDPSYYFKKSKFFSKNESIFFKKLYKILNIIDHHRYIVFSKVRVSDII